METKSANEVIKKQVEYMIAIHKGVSALMIRDLWLDPAVLTKFVKVQVNKRQQHVKLYNKRNLVDIMLELPQMCAEADMLFMYASAENTTMKPDMFMYYAQALNLLVQLKHVLGISDRVAHSGRSDQIPETIPPANCINEITWMLLEAAYSDVIDIHQLFLHELKTMVDFTFRPNADKNLIIEGQANRLVGPVCDAINCIAGLVCAIGVLHGESYKDSQPVRDMLLSTKRFDIKFKYLYNENSDTLSYKSVLKWCEDNDCVECKKHVHKNIGCICDNYKLILTQYTNYLSGC